MGESNHEQPGRAATRRSRWRLIALAAVVLLLVNYWIATQLPGSEPPARISYTPTFLKEVRAGNVEEISSTGNTISGEFKGVIDPAGSPGPTSDFRTEIPTFANEDSLARLLEREAVVVNAEPPEVGRSLIANLLLGLLPTVLLVGVLIYIVRRSGAGGAMGFGRSRARRIQSSDADTTFDDVAGIDEAKAELAEIVDFLRSPDKYRRLGAHVPRGVLLSGPPGTGKTLLARAVAGEAKVPFFSASAAEFIEMVVGVGASRVRDLFEQAKKAAPAIVFVDELDAIGRHRSAAGGGGGGSDEREQTLNQILTEMDGFDDTTGVILLGATNRPELLDSALLRPGRFDRRIVVQAPDSVGRRRILEVHTRSVPLAGDVDLASLAATTPGMVGADLANLVNEAALLAARRGQVRVDMHDFGRALERVVLGAERKVIMSDEDRRRTAYHEAGHALVGMLTPGADPIRKISIIPRGMALGVTVSAPESDRFSYDREYLVARIKVMLGGRVADELVHATVTTGAESDLRQLTALARNMVIRWGMSDAIGPVTVAVDGNGAAPARADEPSEATQQLVDLEIRRIVDHAHEEVVGLLSQHRDKLDALAEALLERETLDEIESYAVAAVARTPSMNGSADMPNGSADMPQLAPEV